MDDIRVKKRHIIVIDDTEPDEPYQIYLKMPLKYKNVAKNLGVRWDKQNKLQFLMSDSRTKKLLS